MPKDGLLADIPDVVCKIIYCCIKIIKPVNADLFCPVRCRVMLHWTFFSSLHMIKEKDRVGII